MFTDVLFQFSDVLFHTKPDGAHYIVKNEISLQQMKVGKFIISMIMLIMIILTGH